MSKRPKKWIVVAEGEDNIVESWNEEFAPMAEVYRYVSMIDNEGVKVDWPEVCLRVPGLKESEVSIGPDDPWREFLDFLESNMDCVVSERIWDGGMPGQSGTFLTVKLKSSDKEKFLQTARQLLKSLQEYWKDHRFEEP